MSAVKAIRALLAASAPVVDLVGAKIFAGTIPQGTVMPAIEVKHIVTVPMGAIDAQAEFSIVTSRIQVTAHAKSYGAVKAILVAARKACNYQRGALADVSVISVLVDEDGPDLESDDATIHYQSTDFKVTFHRSN